MWTFPDRVNKKSPWSLTNSFFTAISTALSPFMHKCIKFCLRKLRFSGFWTGDQSCTVELEKKALSGWDFLFLSLPPTTLPIFLVLSFSSIHRRCGWLLCYKQLPLQLGLMTLRGRQLWSSGLQLFISPLKSHLMLLQQSWRPPASVSLDPVFQSWLAQVIPLLQGGPLLY